MYNPCSCKWSIKIAYKTPCERHNFFTTCIHSSYLFTNYYCRLIMKQIPLKIYISICGNSCSFHGDRLVKDIWTWHCIVFYLILTPAHISKLKLPLHRKCMQCFSMIMIGKFTFTFLHTLCRERVVIIMNLLLSFQREIFCPQDSKRGLKTLYLFKFFNVYLL